MTPEEILACEPRVLSQAQREFYFEHGYVMVESLISADWLAYRTNQAKPVKAWR